MKFSFFLFLMMTSPSWACPLCHTGTGQQVRRGILDENFFSNLMIVASPFFVFGMIILLMSYDGGRGKEYE